MGAEFCNELSFSKRDIENQLILFEYYQYVQKMQNQIKSLAMLALPNTSIPFSRSHFSQPLPSSPTSSGLNSSPELSQG